MLNVDHISAQVGINQQTWNTSDVSSVYQNIFRNNKFHVSFQVSILCEIKSTSAVDSTVIQVEELDALTA